jgi:hypothetical protein
MRASVESFVGRSQEKFKQWTEQEHRNKVEQRLHMLMNEARKYSVTIFQIVAHTDRWHRKINSEAINLALKQGWSIRIQPSFSPTIFIDTNEIADITMQDGDRGLMVEITMKKNLAKIKEGTWVSLYSCSPGDCDLVRTQ